MATLELQIVGDVPEGLELEPMHTMFGRLLERADELELPHEGTINLAFGGDDAIRQLNRDHAGNDYPTDVLSFSYIEDGGAIDGVIGEIMINLDAASHQATLAETPLSVEVALLALHGTLHICGFDHQDDAQRAVVESIQSDIMTSSGYKYRDFKWEK